MTRRKRQYDLRMSYSTKTVFTFSSFQPFKNIRNFKRFLPITAYFLRTKIQTSSASTQLLSWPLMGYVTAKISTLLIVKELGGPSNLINNHNDELKYHVTGRDDIIFNPKNHFWHSGVKFATLHTVQGMKAQRGEEKDQKDIAMILRMMPKKTNSSIFIDEYSGGKCEKNCSYHRNHGNGRVPSSGIHFDQSP